MKINLKATGIELTPAISTYAEKIVSTLEKYLGKDTDAVAHVEIGRTTKHHQSGEVFKAEVHLIGSGLDLYALSEKEDLYAAIDAVKDDIARELKKAKGKRFDLMKRGGQRMKDMMRGLWSFRRRR